MATLTERAIAASNAADALREKEQAQRQEAYRANHMIALANQIERILQIEGLRISELSQTALWHETKCIEWASVEVEGLRFAIGTSFDGGEENGLFLVERIKGQPFPQISSLTIFYSLENLGEILKRRKDWSEQIIDVLA